MKHIYLINPAAGRGDATIELTEKIRSAYGDVDPIAEIYHTTGVGDATRFVREYCTEHPDEAVRFYACGGDGTLGEVVNGAMGFENAAVGLIPSGTGNDYMKNFTERERFFDFEAQRDGEEMAIDILRCNDTYCVNMINIGFDCEVVTKTVEIKRKPWVPGGMAYIFGLIYTLIRKPGVEPEIILDGENLGKNKMLLCAIGNGAFCGGGFKSLPEAVLDDGIMDACLINNVSRVKFLSLVGNYKAGTHVCEKTADIIRYVRCHTLELLFPREQNVCIDGEVLKMHGCKISLLSKALRFVLPRGCAPVRGVTAGAPVGATV